MAREGLCGSTRRDVLRGAGALLACTAVLATRPGLLLGQEGGSQPGEAILELDPVARLPGPLRARPRAAVRAAAPRLIDVPTPLGLLRARDLITLRVRSAGLGFARIPVGACTAALVAGGRSTVLLPRAADARLVYEFPPQHVAEASWYDATHPHPSQLDGPVRAWLSSSSRVAFGVPPAWQAPEHGVRWSTEGLLEWERLIPRVATRAAPPLGVTLPDGTAVGLDHIPEAERWPSNGPAADQTSLELPTRLIISPHEWVGWRHASNYAALVAPRTPLELWHARALAPRSFDASHVSREAEDLRTVRAIWWRDTGGCSEPVSWILPGDPDRRQIVHLSSNFGLGSSEECGVKPEDGARYLPPAIPFRKLALSSRGGTVFLQGKWNPSEPVAPKSPPRSFPSAFSVQEWKQDTVLGRDQFVKVVHKGYLWPFGHEASLVAVARRVVKHLRVNGTCIPVAYLLRQTWVEVREPTVTYPVIADGEEQVGRSCPFREVTLLTLKTPALQRTEQVLHHVTGGRDPDPPPCAPEQPKADDIENEANWRAYAMVPVGVKDPLPFEIRAVDHQGVTAAFRMPLIWVHRESAERRILDTGSLKLDDDRAKVFAAINARTKERTLDLGGHALNLVPAAPPKDGAAEQDHAVEVLRMVFAAETPGDELRGLPGRTPEQRFPWDVVGLLPGTAEKWLGFQSAQIAGKRVLPVSRRCLAWSPAMLAAEVRMADAGVMSPGEPAPTAWVAWHDAYLNCGFDEKSNAAQVFLRILPSGQARMNCDPERGGGLISPSGSLIGISRSTGVITGPAPADEPVESDMPACFHPAAPSVAPAEALAATPERAADKDPLIQFSIGEFDPLKIFKEMGETFDPMLLGAVRLSSVITPLRDFKQALEKVPRLIKEKLGPFLDLEQQIRSKRALLETAIGNLNRLPQDAETLLRRLKDELLGEIDKAVTPFRTLAKTLPTTLGGIRGELDSLLGSLGRNLLDGARAHAQNPEAMVGEINRVVADLRMELRNVLGLVGGSPARTLSQALKDVLPDQPLLQGDLLPPDRLRDWGHEMLEVAGRGLVSVVQGLLGVDAERLLEPLRGILSEPADVLGLPRRVERALSTLEERLQAALAQLGDMAASAGIQATRLSALLQDRLAEFQPADVLDDLAVLVKGWSKLAGQGLGGLFLTGSAWKDSALAVFEQFEQGLETLDGMVRTSLEQTIGALRTQLVGLAPSLDELPAKLESAIRSFDELDALRRVLQGVLTSASDAVRTIRRDLEALQARLPRSIDARYTWDLPLKDGPAERPIFLASTGRCAGAPTGGTPATFKLETVARLSIDNGPSVEVEARIENFGLRLLPSVEFLCVEFERISLRGGSARKPDVEVKIGSITFGEKLKWVKELAESLNPRNGFFLTLDGRGILAGFRFALPTITSGALNLIDLAFEVGLRLPFEIKKELRLRAAVSSRARPFMVTVGVLGGGGHFAVELSPTGLKAFELTLEFGATVALDLGIAKGQAYIRAGIFYSQNDEGTVRLFAYIRAGGSLEILGFIRVTVEFYLALEYYEDAGKSRLEGVARVHVEIEILFFSISVTVEMRKTIAGSGESSGGEFAPQSAPRSAALSAALPETSSAQSLPEDMRSTRERVPWSRAAEGWRQYRRQFVPLRTTGR